MNFARITRSDRAAAGIYEDRRGPTIEQFFAEKLATHVAWQRILIPDERQLRTLSDAGDTALIINIPGNPRAIGECLPLLLPSIISAGKG